MCEKKEKKKGGGGGGGGGKIHWELGGKTLRKTKIPKYPQKLIRFLFMLLVCGIFVFFFFCVITF